MVIVVVMVQVDILVQLLGLVQAVVVVVFGTSNFLWTKVVNSNGNKN